VSKSDYYTRDAANKGIKVDLVKPDGEDSGDYLRILGADSDRFRAASNDRAMDAIDIINTKDPKEREEKELAHRISLIASLVVDWSFDEPCTQAAVEEFLLNAPAIRDQIDQTAADRKRFLANGSPSSEPLPGQNSSSTKSRKGQKSVKSKP